MGEFIQKEITLLITIVGGSVALIYQILSTHFKVRFKNVDHLFETVHKRIDSLNIELEAHKKDTNIVHKDLYEVTKKIELQYAEIRAELKIISKNVCKSG